MPPSRERVVGPTYRRRPRRACADRAADARARRRVRRRASSDITALSFCCSLRHRPSSVIVREPTLATPNDCRAASELALPRCRASRLLHLSPWRLTNNAGSRAVSRQGSTIHVFDISAGIGRRSAVLRRRGPWPRRNDSRVRSPCRRSAPVRHGSFLFASSISSLECRPLCLFRALRSSINQPAPTGGRRSRCVRPSVIVFFVLGGGGWG